MPLCYRIPTSWLERLRLRLLCVGSCHGLLGRSLDNADVPAPLEFRGLSRVLRLNAIERSNRGRLQDLQGFAHGFVGCGAMGRGLR